MHTNTIYKGVFYSAEIIREMRSWIDDCQWNDCDVETELTDWEILKGVDKHYYGGLAAFVQGNTIL